MSDGTSPSDLRQSSVQRLQERYRRLAETRRLRPVAAIVARFNEIDGGMLGAMVSVQLFTTVIPLMIMGFSYMRGFADNASPGTLVIRELGLVRPAADHVREAFGHSSALRSSWTFLGVAGFLIWGIPMGIMIAGIFAKAWHRQQFGLASRLWRGLVWFALYLTMIGLRDRKRFIQILKKIAAEILPTLRGAVSSNRRVIAHFADDEDALAFAGSQWAKKLSELGTSCPDHFLRTKIKPLYVAWNPQTEDAAVLKAGAQGAGRSSRHKSSHLAWRRIVWPSRNVYRMCGPAS